MIGRLLSNFRVVDLPRIDPLSVRCLAVTAGSETIADRVRRHGWDYSRHGSQHECQGPARGVLSAAADAARPSLWLARLVEDRRELVRFWPVIQNMVVQELRVRYQRSILGFVWTLLNPLLMMATLSWVFSQLVTEVEHYPLFLFAGMVPWSFLSSSLNESAVCIIQNEGLIRKIYLPKLVFPLARVLISLVTFVLSLGALFLLLLPLGARLTPSICSCRWSIGLFAVFTLGLGLIVATANTFYRDAATWCRCSCRRGISRRRSSIRSQGNSQEQQWRLRFNPAYYFIELFHDVLYTGQWPRYRSGGGGGPDRGGEPGNRLCHIQVSRRQDGLPTLTGADPERRQSAPPAPLIELQRCLAAVRQLRRQAILAQARRARPGLAPRIAWPPARSSGRCATSRSRSPTASGSASSAATAPARARCCACWPGSIRRPPARSRSVAAWPR